MRFFSSFPLFLPPFDNNKRKRTTEKMGQDGNLGFCIGSLSLSLHTMMMMIMMMMGSAKCECEKREYFRRFAPVVFEKAANVLTRNFFSIIPDHLLWKTGRWSKCYHLRLWK